MSSEETLRLLPQLLRDGDFRGAEQRVLTALAADPVHPGLNAFAAFISANLNKRDEAIRFARKAAAQPGKFPRPAAQAANLLAQFRLYDEALSAARSIDIETTRDPVILDQIGACFTTSSAHQEAQAVYARLAELVPAEPRCRFNLAAAQRYNGELEEAARNFDLASKAGPQAAEAAYARSLLTKASPDRNHVDELAVRLRAPGLDDLSRAALSYAMGKEFEDLGKWSAAFDAWTDGAKAMRQARPYSVEPEINAIDETIKAWPSISREYQRSELTPVFIVSLPRAGSTLLDRILSNRNDVVSAGETEDFIVSLLEDPVLAGLRDPVAIAQRAPDADMHAVGQRYRDALHRRGHRHGYVIDKTPTNFLYAGLIADALPEARIILLDRDPRDAAIATYKTLFRDRYFWSYDLQSIAAYFAAVQRLMQHWLSGAPGRIERVKYEDLVQNTEAEARRLTGFMGLDWDPACLDFAGNHAAVATASAEHVRRPVYASSIGHWKHFKNELEVILPALEAILSP
jgi:tetratricopeptide (TPR) repeat protein